mmetsp:Transcript_4866/g.12518  ORF Transcript_4866/g.12518 Transcript_4866/m.12518 type:complete len:613 (-) Transcript_4866:71-1909(-)
MDHELLLDTAVDEAAVQPRREASKRHRFVVGGITIAVLAVVGVIVATTSGRSTAPSDSGSPRAAGLQAQSSAPPASAGAAKLVAVHPLLVNMPHRATAVAGDDAVEQYSGSFHVETNGHHTHYEYLVQAVKDRVHLEQNHAVDAVSCNGSKLHITFNHTDSATAFRAELTPGRTVITVINLWRGCGTTSRVLRLAANADFHVNGASLSMETHTADITAIFKNANITFNGTGFTADSGSSGHGRPRREADAVRRTTGDDDDFFEEIWNDVTGAITNAWNRVVGDVRNAFSSVQNFMADAEKVEHFIQQLVDNNGDYSKNGDVWSKSVQVGPTPVSSSLPSLTSQYGYDLQLQYALQITDYELHHVACTASGQAHASVNAEGQVFQYSDSGTLGPYTVVPQETFITFTIPAGPVPIPVSISGTMTTKLDWSLSGSVSVSANMAASGSLEAGFQWTQGQGFSPIESHSFTSDAEMNYITATATATGTVVANTQLLIEAMYSVGLQTQVAVSPVVRATVSETIEGGGISVDDSGNGLVATRINPQSPPADSPCHPTTTGRFVDTPSVLATVGVGVSVTAAAVIDIPDLHIDRTYDICSGPCYSHLWNPVESWCIHP